jgi:ELWxxDGT repeat protein
MKKNKHHLLLLLSAFILCNHIFAQSPQVLKDINGATTLNSSSSGYTFVTMNGVAYFTADDGLHGIELWKTDGTEAGTVLIKDINPGLTSSNPASLTVINNTLYFNANSATNGQELWKTDGTEPGTVMVKDITSGTSGSAPQNLLDINGVLFFTASTSAAGRELWKTDGTDAGTVLVKDINPGSASSSPSSLTNVNGNLFFIATTTANGSELWKSDGSSGGTVIVKDITTGTAGTSILVPIAVGNKLVFSANAAGAGFEPWVSDGTTDGTFMLKDINPGPNSGGPSVQLVLGNILVFSATDANGLELWATDGTAAGTIFLKDINPGSSSSTPSGLTVAGGNIFFIATDPLIGNELWKTDGTPAGTALVKDINPGTANSNPFSLVNVNNILYFRALTSANGTEIWKSDGTNAGTMMVKDLNPGSLATNASNFTNVNGQLFCSGTLAGQGVLIKSDGTEAGTVVLNSAEISGGAFSTFYALGNKLLFQYDGFSSGGPSTATGREPWVSDGTDAGTKLIKDINTTTSAGNPGPYTKGGNLVYFAATDATNGTEPWKTDGTEGGTVMIKDIAEGSNSSLPSSFVYSNDIMYFTANLSGAGRELWRTDGTEAGTFMVKDIVPGSSSSSPTLLTDVNGTLFFVATTPADGSTLWKSDGTANGTVMVADLIPGSTTSPSFNKLTNVNGLLFFTAQLQASGIELWKSNGTAAGTVMVKDIIAGTGSPGIDDMIAFNGKLYFSANDGINGNEPWVSDGTEAGTHIFVNIATSGSFPNSNPTNFSVAAGKLFFSAFTPSTQFEPWVSNGTPEGTFMITEIDPGGGGSGPVNFTEMGGLVYFSAGGTAVGRELWRTDGTAAGTVLVKDINTGSGNSNPELLTAVNNMLFFRATTTSGGVELFRSDGTADGTVGFDLYPGSTTSNPDLLLAFNDMLLFTATDQIKGRELWKAIVTPAPSSSFSIVGDTVSCINTTKKYAAVNIVGNNISYNWSLPNGGGMLSTSDSTVTVTWNALGTHPIELYLSNDGGSTISKQKTVTTITGGIAPTQSPMITQFARTLSASNFPDGTYCQWYRNNEAITGANQPTYYAATNGTYTARFISVCAEGPVSNEISFSNDATPQTIDFPAIPDFQLTPNAKVKLNAVSSSGLPVFYQKISGAGFIQNDTLYISGAGTLAGDITIKAIQPGNDIYSPAQDVTRSIRVLRGNQSIVFDSIPDMIYGPQLYQLTGSSTAGLGLTYTVISGNSSVTIQSGNKIKLTGAGTVTIRASQVGNANYLGAAPVERSFCIGIRSLNNISGNAEPCLSTYRYNAEKIPGANYEWGLSGGGILTTHLDTAWVSWQTAGSHVLKVKANTGCDTVYSSESILDIATSGNPPSSVTGMVPADGAIDQQLPLRLSWIPGSNTTLYDLYVWNANATQPATPYAANLENIYYTLPANSFSYNTTYKWRIVSKNPCSQTAGPIQQFSIIPLPDLVVSDVQAPASATSGQTITISWKVTNTGPGKTATNATWYDGVYFALDTVPNVSFHSSPNWNPTSWNSLTAAGRPLLLGKKLRPASLESGQFYTNSLNFTLPRDYSFPVYIYVITDNEHPNWKIMQVSVANDTARKQTPMDIALAPTPDLRVDSVFTPSNTFSGSTISVTYKVKNYGTLTPAGEGWVDSIFLSQSPLFDRNNAFPLKFPKSDDSYYPNAADASFTNSTQLNQDSFYTRTSSVVIPNFIFGTWFVYVKTNARQTGQFIYEGALTDNNLGQAQLQVFLTPTPKLTVNSLNVPINNASTTQPFGANWNIRNEGFRDNIERSRGHYITMGECRLPCNRPNCVSSPLPAIIRDSLGFGSSYWIDRVYLSTDPTGLNVNNAVLVKEVKHGVLNSGIYPNLVNCPANVIGNVNTHTVINNGSDFFSEANFNIPPDLQPGTYYLYVYTNPTKTVFEYPGTPQIKRSSLPITINRPDVTVPVVTVPPTSTGGQTIAVNYTVQNNGPGTVFNQLRKDRIYISNSPAFDASAQLIGTNSFTEDLQVNSGVSHSFNYILPPATTGLKYFYVISNYDSSFRETNYVNNLGLAALTNVLAAIPADLVVSSVQTTDSVFTVFPSQIIYTVTNGGSGIAADNWTDSVFISCNPLFSPATSYFIGKRNQVRNVAPGATYRDTLTVNIKYSYNINNCFAEAMYGNAFFFVKTNADTSAYEASAVQNNVGGSGSKIMVNPLVDHIVSSVSGPDQATVGAAYTASWGIKNIGYNPNQTQYYSSWYDAIYFSSDSIADGGDIKAAEYLKYIRIDRNKDSAFSKSFNVPYMPSGEYYVYVHNNPTDRIPAEKFLDNNVNFIRDISGKAKKIQVITPALADLKDTITSAPVSVAAGQPITIIYKITNAGNGITAPGNNFQNRILLSPDFAALPNSGDKLLATRNRTSPLNAGQYYFDTVTVTIPSTTSAGNYILISQANSNHNIIETNINNNLGYSLLNVYEPPLSDLVVSNVMKPDTVILGYTLDTVKWVVQNTSGEQARGRMKDGIYLSAGDFFDSTALLLGIIDKNILMQPLDKDTIGMAPLVTDLAEGDYNLFVKTDLLNNIKEELEDNNTGVSATPVYVKVKELLMNVNETNTLQNINRFYKLRIPDSLIGSTILVTLTTPDSLTVRNEMFVAGGFVPTAAHYDYRYEIPNYGTSRSLFQMLQILCTI